MTLREIIYELLDEGRRNGAFSAERDKIDLIAAAIHDILRTDPDIPLPLPDNDELVDMVDDWFDVRRIDERNPT